MNFGTKGCMYCEGICNKECLIQDEPKCTCERPNDNTCDFCDKKETSQILTEAKTGSLSECIKTVIDDQLNSIEEDKKLFSKEEVRNIAEWSFHFYKTNEYNDSELENEWYKLLEEKLNK